MNKKEFKKWVDEIVREYNTDDKVNCLEFQEQGKIILVDEDTAQTGMSKGDVEQFDYRTGIAIAYANLRGLAVPTVLEENKESEFGRVKDGDTYWTIAVDDSDGIVRAFFEEDDYCVVDDNYFNNNNYFLTKERAKEVADKINFLMKLERLHDIYCPDFIPNWNDNSFKYCILFNSERNKYIFDIYMISHIELNVYFPTEEIAQKVCDELNKELI